MNVGIVSRHGLFRGVVKVVLTEQHLGDAFHKCISPNFAVTALRRRFDLAQAEEAKIPSQSGPQVIQSQLFSSVQVFTNTDTRTT